MNNLKQIVGDIYAWLANISGRTNIERCCSNRLVLLTFHRCLPGKLRENYPYPGLVVTPDELSWLLKVVRPHFHIGTISSMVDKFYSQEGTPPFLGISFDDGQWDNYKYALPVLEHYNCRATFYIPSSLIEKNSLIWHDLVGFGCQFFCKAYRQQQERWLLQLPSDLHDYAYSPALLVSALKSLPDSERSKLVKWLEQNLPHQNLPQWARLMTWKEIRQLSRLGHDIGSHTCSHAILPQLSEETMKFEIEHSRDQIEAEVGVPVKSLCYPNGDFNDNCVRVVRDSGYTNAVTTIWGHNKANDSLFTLRRMDIDQRRHRSFWGNLSIDRTKLRLTDQHPGLQK